MEPTAQTTTPAATSPPPAPTPTSPPPVSAPAPTPTPAATVPAAGPGSPGSTAGQGTSPAPGVSGQTPAYPADIQAKLAQFEQMQAQVREYEQYRHLIPLGYQAYQSQLTGQQRPAAPTQPEAPANPFGLPQFDYRLLDFVGKDPNTGQLVLQPGAPPDALLRVQEYQSKLQDVQRNFWQDPGKFLTPLIEAKAKEIAQKQYQEQFQGHQHQTQAQQILEQNKGWLYAADAQGQPVTRFDPATGRNVPVLSAAGQHYAQAVQQLAAQGVTDPAQQHRLALNEVKVMAYEQQLKQAQAGTQGQQAAQQFLQTQAAQPPSTQPTPSTLTPPPAREKSLRELMRERFHGNGITDDVLARQVAGGA